MLPLQDLLVNLNLVKRELMIPLDTQKFFYVDADNTKNFLDQVLEMEETNMKFFNVKQSKPYSNSLDKATIVNNSNATVMQQETFTKTTTDSFTFTNSRGLNKGGAVNATIGTAFLGGVGTTLNLSFNVTNTASTSKNVAQSRSQQQTITCPAQTSLVATWVIKNVDIDADYKMVLKLGQKPALKYGLIPGKVVTSDQPVAPVYRYTDAKGERFVYLPSTDAQVTDFYLDDLNPVFYVPAPPTQSNLAIQAGGSHRGHLKNLLWKGAHTDRALVPVYASGSSQLDSSNASTELQQTFQVNSQFTTGSVALWRYRKAGTEEPQFRLIPSNNPEMIPGWSNEGSVGFVYLAPPGMKDLDGTKLGGHAHALNEVSPNEKEKDVVAATKKKLKCSKCWNKIELMETYFRCEQCKTPYMECVECHQKSEKPVEKLLDQVVAKFYEAFGSLEKKKRSFAVLGKMHCTQGTHTFIDVSPMTDSDKDQAQQQVQPQMKEVAEEEKQKEKSRKSKKMVEEFKYTKQYIEEDTKEKKSSHKKTEKVLDNDLPLPPPPPPLVPAMSQLSIQQPLPPPPPPLPPNFACTAPSPFGNPYFANPTQMFINNPSTVQPYFAPAPAPPPPPAPFVAGPVPTTTHTITTTYPPVTNAPNGRRGSIAGPAPASAPPPPPPPPPPASPAYPTPSVEDLYSMPMGHYNNPNYASPVWGAPRYDVPNYNEQGNYNSPQPFAQPSYDPNAYSGMPAGYPAYDAKPHYNPDAPPAQGYDSNFNQSYQSPYQQPPPVNRTRNFFTRHQIL